MMKNSTLKNSHHFIKSEIQAPIKIFPSNFFPECTFGIPSDPGNPLCVVSHPSSLQGSVRQKVFRIVSKCPKMSQNVQFRRIVLRTDLFLQPPLLKTYPTKSSDFSMHSLSFERSHFCPLSFLSSGLRSSCNRQQQSSLFSVNTPLIWLLRPSFPSPRKKWLLHVINDHSMTTLFTSLL